MKLKMFSFCSNQVELPVFTLYISTSKLLVQSVVYTYQNVVKITQFNFSLLSISF